MPLSIETIETGSRFGVTIRHTLYAQDSNTLLVLLPGRGYYNEHPIMHYTGTVGRHKGWDVLSVKYGFQVTGEALTVERLPDAGNDAEQAVAAAVKRGYQNVIIAGKSMGTPFAAHIASTLANVRGLILHTPVQGATTMTGTIPALATIGTADGAYDPDITLDSETLRWLVVDDLNHALEKDGDWRASIHALETIIGAVVDFLETL